MDVLDIPFRSRLKRVFIFLNSVGKSLDLRVKGVVGTKVLLGAGFEGVDKAAAYDPKY